MGDRALAGGSRRLAAMPELPAYSGLNYGRELDAARPTALVQFGLAPEVAAPRDTRPWAPGPPPHAAPDRQNEMG